MGILGTINDAAQRLSQFRQDSSDYDKYGSNYRQIKEDEELARRLEMEKLRSQTESAANNATISSNNAANSTRDEKMEKLRDDQEKSAIAQAGKAAYTGDPDDASAPSEEEMVSAGMRAHMDADRRSDELERRAKDSNNQLKGDQNEADLRDFDRDQGLENRTQDINMEKEEIGLEAAKRKELFASTADPAEAELARLERNYKTDNMRLNPAVAKGDSPKSRSLINSGAGEGFIAAVEQAGKAHHAATDGMVEITQMASQQSIAVIDQLTVGGRIGLTGPTGEPMTEKDLNIISKAGGTVEAATELGYVLDNVNGAINTQKLKMEIAGRPGKMQRQQQDAIAETAVEEFTNRWPNILEQAADPGSEMLDGNQLDALEMLLDQMERVVGPNKERFPQPLMDALTGLKSRNP